MHKVPALLLVLVLSLYPCALPAQTTNGSITGRVTDPSKATIPDAKIAAVNAGTNFRYETFTNGAGEYTLANLPPGTYLMEVEKTGFKKLVRPDVILHVQDALAIDFDMADGSVSETIRVEAGAPTHWCAKQPDSLVSELELECESDRGRLAMLITINLARIRHNHRRVGPTDRATQAQVQVLVFKSS